MRKAKTAVSRLKTPKKLKNDYFGTKCYSMTSMVAFVKKKEVVPCLRYKDGSVFDDEHYVTTFVLADGTEIRSYSKIIFFKVIEGAAFDIPVSFLTLPNGRQIIYA
ncbi:hypothetical protein IKF94_02710 [Candidatus Saccharibacteria bacterium]|nr:hypothetical protein [Candidatus Saccharibacteria bacterium]